MSNNTDKLWLLQNEKALLAIIREPNRPLHSICQAHNANFDALSDFLEKYCPEDSLSAARLQELKVELGILSVSTASEQPAPRAARQQRAPEVEDDPGAGSAGGAEAHHRPWLELTRRPKSNTVAKYRDRLESIAAGEARTGTEGSWYATLNKWFGTVNPTAAQAKEFLAFVDDASTSAASKPDPAESAPPPDQDAPPAQGEGRESPEEETRDQGQAGEGRRQTEVHAAVGRGGAAVGSSPSRRSLRGAAPRAARAGGRGGQLRSPFRFHALRPRAECAPAAAPARGRGRCIVKTGFNHRVSAQKKRWVIWTPEARKLNAERSVRGLRISQAKGGAS